MGLSIARKSALVNGRHTLFLEDLDVQPGDFVSYYARARDRMVHDVLASLRHKLTLDQMGTRLRPNAEWKLQSPARMVKRWSHHPEGMRATRSAKRPAWERPLTLPGAVTAKAFQRLSSVHAAFGSSRSG